MARPANALPNVSCSAKPMTTALTAEVVSSLSWNTSVATRTRSPMTMKSCRIAGYRSGTRSSRSGFRHAITTRLMRQRDPPGVKKPRHEGEPLDGDQLIVNRSIDGKLEREYDVHHHVRAE